MRLRRVLLISLVASIAVATLATRSERFAINILGALGVFLLATMGSVLSGIFGGLASPMWPRGFRAITGACFGFWSHFVVLYLIGVALWWPLGSVGEPFARTRIEAWYGLCAVAAAIAALVAATRHVAPRPSNTLPASTHS